MTGIYNYNSFLGDPILKLTLSGNTLTVKTSRIPEDINGRCRLVIAYSTVLTWYRRQRRNFTARGGRKSYNDRHHDSYNNLFRMRGYQIFIPRTNYTYTTNINLHRHINKAAGSSGYPPNSFKIKIRAEYRFYPGYEKTKYVSNIIEKYI